MNPDELFARYRELQAYVSWEHSEAELVHAVAPVLEPCLPSLIDDFYAEIERHPQARKVITGGPEQIGRLKGTLLGWVRELLSGRYDRDYVARRWRVGWRHVEIGLDQVYTNMALSRLRTGLVKALQAHWRDDGHTLQLTVRALNKLLDLDLAIIEDAYQAEYADRLKRRSDAVFRSLVEAAPCMIVILRPDHTILYFSPFAGELTGYAAAEVIGKDYSQVFLSEDYRKPVAEEVARVFAQARSRGYENPVTCRDGTRRWMVWNAQLLMDYEGGPAVLKVGQDITNLKDAQERALQAERLAAIGQMMTGLAHESGNALARSQACLEMLALEVEDRPEALDLIGRAQKAQDHLRQLYDEVRGYAAPIRLHREVWDLAGIWRQAWQNLAMLRQSRDAVLHEHTDGLDLHCAVDHFRLEQVFRNILENSLAACPDPVVIDVHASEAPLPNGSVLQLVVCDNGPGLSAEQRQRVFEPFFTTKTKGTGLGMAIAKRIVEAHGGHISVAGQGAGIPAAGAQIILSLPREA